jgi:hypothetical protein
MPSAFAQEESTCYELSAMNFHLGETPPRELWEREQTEPVARLMINHDDSRDGETALALLHAS